MRSHDEDVFIYIVNVLLSVTNGTTHGAGGEQHKAWCDTGHSPLSSGGNLIMQDY